MQRRWAWPAAGCLRGEPERPVKQRPQPSQSSGKLCAGAALDAALQQIQADSGNWVKCAHAPDPSLPQELNRASGVII